MSDWAKRILTPLASLRLTVVLLAMAMLLVYAGTWAQIDTGIWQVQKQYFHSFLTWIEFQVFLPRPQAGQERIPGGFPMLGGYAIGLLMLINLLAAHAVHFAFSAKRIGIVLIHLGLILLLVGEGITSGAAVESQMSIDEGSYADYSQDLREAELAVIDPSAADHDEVVVIPGSRLRDDAVIADPRLPVTVRVVAYYPNAEIVRPQESEGGTPSVATAGVGLMVRAVARARAGGTDMDSTDYPSAYVTLSAGGKDLKTWLVSTYPIPLFQWPQQVVVDGKTYLLSLRFKRYYKPYRMHLVKFSHDVYPGTDVARNYSSRIRLVDPSRNEDREVVIRMNDPLRYAGETFYQASFRNDDKTTVLQVVRNPAWLMPYIACIIGGLGMLIHFGMHLIGFVGSRETLASLPSSPGTPLSPSPGTPGEGRGEGPLPVGGVATVDGVADPVTASPTPSAGQFVGSAKEPPSVSTFSGPRPGSFADRSLRVAAPHGPQESRGLSSAAPELSAGSLADPTGAPQKEALTLTLAQGVRRQGVAGRVFLAILTALCVLYVAARAVPWRQAGPFDLRAFGQLPLSYEGRVQPLDSLARNSLKMLSGRQTLTVDGQRQPAIQWLIDLFARPADAEKVPVISIDHPDILALLSLDPHRKVFSITELKPQAEKLRQQFERAEQVDPKRRSLYQKKVLELRSRIDLYLLLAQRVGALYLTPPLQPGELWQPLGTALEPKARFARPHPAAELFGKLLASYHDGQSADFNSHVAKYQVLLRSKLPHETTKAAFESFFNRFDPFLQCMVFYVLAFVLACCSWLIWRQPLGRAAYAVIVVALVLHTLGLIARIYISGRPPVTNLASSAIFIAWGAVILAVGLEWFHRNAIASATAAALGFGSLLIADRLALEGDTMKVLVAVLDTNFWLATHVIIITLGYAATFLAGLLGVAYVLGGLFTRALTPPTAKSLSRMIYGIVCFAMLFSFVGTVLGGIWADQSWGRFWGWDPKENGAVLIVLWNALLLHARWAKMVRERGVALLAIAGNIITSWSWFGTNMLGVGLHSYGFMDSALLILLVFVASQLVLIGLGNLPLGLWRSPLAGDHR